MTFGSHLPASRWPAEEQIERLYLEPPDRFARARDRLAGILASAGYLQGAVAVRRLRRPTRAAWLVNQVSLREPGPTARLLAAAEQVEKAERLMLEGAGTPGSVRDAIAEHRDALAELMVIARRIAGDSGEGISELVLDRVEETLQAATGDRATRVGVSSGRLQREASAIGIGPRLERPRGAGLH